MTTLNNALSVLLSKLSLVLIALAATTTASYAVSPQKPSIGQILTIPAVLERVAACESTGNPNDTPRQFNSNGSILWGNDPTTGKPIERDCGEFQVNTWAHGRYPDGLDVCGSQADNEAYALMLYAKNGLKDWAASSKCWSSD